MGNSLSGLSGSPKSLPDLLFKRSASSHGLLFLSDDGNVVQSLTYADLYAKARDYSQRLIASGIEPRGKNVVIASFDNHHDHIILFWACCLAGIPLCPIPALHPEESRRLLFLNHLKSLFQDPILVGNDEVIAVVDKLVPSFKTTSWKSLTASQPQRVKHKSIYPKTKPTPDDIVCFMLTSGSTGNSKAVGLRHSNLLSAIQGKIKHHNTESTSRFLNWIAFDHVACMSEVHLQALLADSWQYHVSPSAIIRKPRNLLEWSSKYRITYSFSPNFLLAQICRDTFTAQDSLDLSQLKAFISGGEAVPVGTAVEFADILARFGARRDVLRAGFGMTETGAGCIYDTRDILQDASKYTIKYLSLGRCCNGVSIRVIDHSTGLPCPSMKEGQLQIKGPTIFREYHNNPKATEESFMDGWFITGDTAIIDKDNNLYLMGRDKDCININGVKHPSVDVEHFIEDSHVDNVPDSYVYVCPMRLPNADTETYAVFYQHILPIEDELTADDLIQILSTNRALKRACVVFCAQSPHVILPLPRSAFVKTALGKVSRSFLAAAYLKGNFTEIEHKLKDIQTTADERVEETLSNTEELIFDVVFGLFNLPQTTTRRNRVTSLFDLGASSMHLMQLKQILQERLSIPDIPTIEMLRRPEIGQLALYIEGILANGNARKAIPYDPLICLNPNGQKSPLFLLHPGVGEILIFIHLARVLNDDRPIYALRARGFDEDDEPFKTFEEMVELYAKRIQESQPNGPYYLCGYSFGGAIAFDITKKLESQGKQVSWVGVMNLPTEIQFRMKELVWLEVLVNLCMFLALIPTQAFDEVKDLVIATYPELRAADKEPEAAEDVIRYIFTLCNQGRLDELHLNLGEFRRWVNVAYYLTCSGRNYVVKDKVSPALLSVFCAIPLPSLGTKEQYKEQRLSKWQNHTTGAFELIDVDGEHYTMIAEENVNSFAEKIRGCLARAEQTQSIVTPLPLPARNNFSEVPVIDFSLAKTDKAEYFKQLQHALGDAGFGVFANVPGFEDSFQQEMFSLAKQFFSKPQEWKDSLGTGNSHALRGYFRTDTIPEPHKSHAEAFRLGKEMPEPKSIDGTKVPFWLRLHEGPNQWPSESDIPHFRKKMETLFERYHALNLTLNTHICELLNIQYEAVSSYFPENIEFNSAIWHYFPVTDEMLESAKNGFVRGMHEHRDPASFITCLIQSRPGLQVQNHEGEWLDIPYVPGGVVCNIGMQLMRLTGGRFVATLHRVNTLVIDEDRFTIPYVLSTKLEKTVIPLPQFDNPELAKIHVAPSAKIQKLSAIEDPLIRSGFARLSLFPAITKNLYPEEFEQGVQMGVL